MPRMQAKLIRIVKALKFWMWQNLGNLSLWLAVAKVMLLALDAAQERRQLIREEIEF
jgi:hypothetical protein